MSCGIKLRWGLDGCAQWRAVTITITLFKRIFKIVCGLVVLVMFYFIYMVTTAYLVLEKLKPSHVTDLP